MSRRKRSLHRKRGGSPRNTVFHVFTDGKNTETAYLKMLQQRFSGVVVEVSPETYGMSPENLVKVTYDYVKRRKKKEGKYDIKAEDPVWVVFDHDDRSGFGSAKSICCEERVRTATSNPCFELWLLLHIEFFDQPCDQHGVQKRLEDVCKSYNRERGKIVDVERFIDFIQKAEKNAENQKLRREEEGEPAGRPSTDIFKLVRALRNASSN